MYWLNQSKLAEDLRAGRVDEKERFKYYLATVTTLSIVIPVFFYSVGPLGIDDLIYLIVSAILGIIGIILCYRVNKSGDNTDFIPRMICLSWTVGILGVLMLILFSNAFHDKPRISWAPIYVVFFYGTVYFYLVRVAQAKEGRTLVEIVTTNLSFGEAALLVLMFLGSIFLFQSTEDYISAQGGLEIIARLSGLVVTGLGLILIGWVLAALHKRSKKLG
jgi:hypothetical protein